MQFDSKNMQCDSKNTLFQQILKKSILRRNKCPKYVLPNLSNSILCSEHSVGPAFIEMGEVMRKNSGSLKLKVGS